MKFVIRNTKDGYVIYRQRWWGANQKIGIAPQGGLVSATDIVSSYMLSISTYDFFSIDGECDSYNCEFKTNYVKGKVQ